MNFGLPSNGFVATGYESVREAFERNFLDHGDIGAAFAAYCHGELVVDLWGGAADPFAQRPWCEDTLQLIFSGSKGLVAMCMLLLIDNGECRLDERVATYWPEFGQAGKADVTVREIVTHTCRLPGLARRVTVDDLIDDREMGRLLAAQPQDADPRARSTYHPLTYGWLCGELVHRIDGRTIGRFFADEVAEPLGLDLYIGLPASEAHRVSVLSVADNWGTGPTACPDATDEFQTRVWGNPPLFSRSSFPWNRPDVHACEMPGVNAIGTARAIAEAYSSLPTILSTDAIRLAGSVLERRHEPVLGVEQAFSVGFTLPVDLPIFGPEMGAWGHNGAGGSVHGIWPARNIAFSYTMNRMRDDLEIDPRGHSLLAALETAARSDR